jgi:hypothetical protein
LDKAKIAMPLLVASLFYDLSTEKTVTISNNSERRERDLQELFRRAKLVDSGKDADQNFSCNKVGSPGQECPLAKGAKLVPDGKDAIVNSTNYKDCPDDVKRRSPARTSPIPRRKTSRRFSTSTNP